MKTKKINQAFRYWLCSVRKNHKIIPIIFICISINSGLFAQCNEKLVEKAVLKSGMDAIYLKDFKIKLLDKKKSKVAPVIKFNTFLNEGKLYRFTVENAEEYEGEAILQLYERDHLLASTYHLDSAIDHQTFDFYCEKSGYFKILMSFIENKKGCAVGVMSLVINDSTLLSDPVLLGKDTVQTLYVGVENPLSVAATKKPSETMSIEIDNGEILNKNGLYSAMVQKEGPTIIKIVVQDSLGNTKEESSFNFLSIKIPDPTVSLGGLTGGLINKFELLNKRYLQIIPPPGFENIQYSIVKFSVSSEKDGMYEIYASGRELNTAQQNYIKSLEQGSKLFIKNIVVRSPDGKEQTLQPLGFIVD